ncbi:hypothetical protein O4220_19645 [Rhodococcus ruber]|uniref:Uncharacterized protein n=1 Tax=Rhodococcus ruber TaxID=1830 RepID=A0ABT4MJ60_9NOCA|nr:hypothetical protein [Rhodococcus ruber]MCZ4520729.1 hypothetical protein [Rhodococcus ruber]
MTSDPGAEVEWPSHYPNQCPPADAAPAEGVFYRLVDELPPTGDDVLSHMQIKLDGRRFQDRNFDDECMASGLSLFNDDAPLLKKRAKLPALRKKMLAKGDISGPGKIKQSGADISHYTWWRPIGDNGWESFEVVT